MGPHSNKTNLTHVADIFFDLRNEFHANQMEFEIFGEKNLTLLAIEIKKSVQNKSQIAEI